MRRLSEDAAEFLDSIAVDTNADDAARATPLGGAALGFCGRVDAIRASGNGTGLSPAELENRLIEIGFVEGARVEILHEGAFGHDPIAVRVNGATIALRRREAMAIHVRTLDPEP
jgi:ferrous iron transport protein A